MQAQIEALLYAAGEAGITLSDLADLLGIAVPALREQLLEMQARFESDDSTGLQLQLSDVKALLVTKPAHAELLKRYFDGPKAPGLSQAALETLAIVAYQQPITRIEIDEIRGVQSSGALATLASHQLVQEAGRKEVPGRPILYATTDQFLTYFDLKNLAALPPLANVPGPDDDAVFAEFNAMLSESEEN